jgi:predicted secreted Zn-dependent protease
MYKFIAMTLLLSASAQAEPIVNTETHYYLVDGKNAQAIRKDMNAKRSGSYDAYTSWRVNWHFYWNNNRSSCTLTKLDTKVAVKFTLPKLATDSVATVDAKQRWDSYYTALIAHENGHRDFGVKAATAIEAGLLAMGKRDNCKNLEKEANGLAHSLLANAIADEKQYDIDTHHGMNDGAVFP